MVGEAGRLRGRIRATVVLAASALVAGVAAEPMAAWVVDGSCRDGVPQGPYQLRSADGELRVAGAFNAGKRTGSFLFWSADGVRVAHIPYDDGERNGTVALWYAGSPGREPARRLESAWRHGRRDGLTRSWYADGHRRSETEYAAGRIVASAGWTDAGQRLPDSAARELARRDAEAADAQYAELDAVVDTHLPRCE